MDKTILTMEEYKRLIAEGKKKRIAKIEDALNSKDYTTAAHYIDMADNWEHEQQALLLLYADRIEDPKILFHLIMEVYTNDGYNFPKKIIQKAKRIAKEIPQEERLSGLPAGDVITIYRGASKIYPGDYMRLRTAISWTTNKACAVWFANRRNGVVWKGTIDRNKIIAYTNDRNEYEIIQHMNVKNPHICKIDPKEWKLLLNERNERVY